MPTEPNPASLAHAPSLPMLRPLVLASASQARRALLTAAGLDVEVRPVGVDEAALKRGLTAEGAAPRDIADLLAEMKAVRAASRDPAVLVIGCDQVLVANGVVFDKPADLHHARAHLRALRGRSHELLSAVVVAEGGSPVWRHVASARLTMRDFSDEFLDAYLDGTGDTILSCVGAYRFEGLGAQLFSKVEGDHATILGLPLLPLLDYLRTRRVILS